MSKVLVRAVGIRLNEYLNVNDLLPCYQSAFRKKHSTETAMLRVWSDMLKKLLMAADRRQVTQLRLLCLLDLSAAFDCVDHDLLLQRLQLSFSLTGVAFRWIRSFLTGRTQQIAYQGQLSTSRPLLFGVSGIRAGTITVHSVHRRTLSRGRTARHLSASVRRRQPSICQRRRQRHFDSNPETKLLTCVDDINDRMSSNRQVMWLSSSHQVQQINVH